MLQGFGLVAVGLQQLGEGALGQQLHVFGEHAEQAAGEVVGDHLGAAGAVPLTPTLSAKGARARGGVGSLSRVRERVGVSGAGFKRLGQLRQQGRHLARDLGADARGVQAGGVLPDARQALAYVRTRQVGQRDAVAARVGIRGVGGAALAELGIQLDHVAHVHHDQKGRAAFKGGQGARVALGLAAGAQQAVVETLGVGGSVQLLGLQHKGAAPVAVDAPGAAAAVAVGKGDGALEHVVLIGRGVRLGHAQQIAQVDDEALRRGQLAGAHAGPAGDEGGGGSMGGVRGVGCGGEVGRRGHGGQ